MAQHPPTSQELEQQLLGGGIVPGDVPGPALTAGAVDPALAAQIKQWQVQGASLEQIRAAARAAGFSEQQINAALQTGPTGPSGSPDVHVDEATGETFAWTPDPDLPNGGYWKPLGLTRQPSARTAAREPPLTGPFREQTLPSGVTVIVDASGRFVSVRTQPDTPLDVQRFEAEQGRFEAGEARAGREFTETMDFRQQQEQNRLREGLMNLAADLSAAAQQTAEAARQRDVQTQGVDAFRFSLGQQQRRPSGPTSIDIWKQQNRAIANQQIPTFGPQSTIPQLQGVVGQLLNQPQAPTAPPGLPGAARGATIDTRNWPQAIVVGEPGPRGEARPEIVVTRPGGETEIIPLMGSAAHGGYLSPQALADPYAILPPGHTPGAGRNVQAERLAAMAAQPGFTGFPTDQGNLLFPGQPSAAETAAARAAEGPRLAAMIAASDQVRAAGGSPAEQQAAADAAAGQPSLGGGAFPGGTTGAVGPVAGPGGAPVAGSPAAQMFPTPADLESIAFLGEAAFPGLGRIPTLSELTPDIRSAFGILPEGAPQRPVQGDIPAFQARLDPATIGDTQYVLPAVHKVARTLLNLSRQFPSIFKLAESAFGTAGQQDIYQRSLSTAPAGVRQLATGLG